MLTVPWAVEYLSMMDPVAPLRDYFSVVLNFLYRIYRFLQSSLLTKEINAQIEKTRKTFYLQSVLLVLKTLTDGS